MAKKRSHYKGFRKTSGAKAGATALRVHVCQACGLQHPPGKLRPETCMGCGSLLFIKFDSAGEAGRWATLTMLEKYGKISDLKRQVRFDLMAARVLEGRTVTAKVGQYVADFVYMRDGERVIEDFKGAITDLASWKLRHMEAMGLPVKLTS